MSGCVLVSGAAGYIGSHCVLELLLNNHNVIAIDNFANSKCGLSVDHSAALNRVEEISGRKPIFYRCDLLDQAKLKSIFQKHRIEHVVHLAALKAVGESLNSPLNYYKNNICGTVNLLQAMRSSDVFSLVFSSSCCVYGNAADLPITEQHPVGNVTNVYGRTKHMVENILEDLARSDQRWNIISLRYFNPVGAHPSGLIGEDPTSNFSNLMPYLAQVAIGNKPYLNIFGDDYNTQDGTGVRDYIHVMDLASGHLAALNKLKDTRVGFKPFNLGLGRGLSVRQLVNTWQQVTGTSIPTKMCARRVGDVDALVCDPSLAMSQLNWTPKFNVEDMCRDTWNWQKKNPNGYQAESNCPAKVTTNGESKIEDEIIS